MATKKLPCVVLENSKFRLVAKERTKQSPSCHAMHMVVDLNDDDENQDCVDLFAEMRFVDSMKQVGWRSCDFTVAHNSITASQVRTSMLDLAQSVQDSVTQSPKPSKKDK